MNNNGVNQTTNQGTVTNTNTTLNTQNVSGTTSIATTHPQVLAASGDAQARAQAAVDAAGVRINAPVETETKIKDKKAKKEKQPRQRNKLAGVLFFIIILLVGGCGYLWYYHQQQMLIMAERCTPVSTSGEEKELDLNSNIVKDLYSRVATTLREDLGEVELNDDLKLYLAYRQINKGDFYESHCKLFQKAGIEPFTCDETSGFTPLAFKAETLEVEYRKMFGYDAVVPHGNIQLGTTCIGGYEYIESRGEYVQGQCSSTGATLYRVDKELTSAYSKKSIIVLRERVKYYGSEGLTVPDRLVSGTYEYTFKLDMNYNYTFVSKKLVSE